MYIKYSGKTFLTSKIRDFFYDFFALIRRFDMGYLRKKIIKKAKKRKKNYFFADRKKAMIFLYAANSSFSLSQPCSPSPVTKVNK